MVKAKKKVVPVKNAKSPYENQLKWIVVLMVLVILIAGGVYYFVQETKKFQYAGIRFDKMMFDKLPLYHGVIPITDPAGALVANYNLYLRNDPRSLEDISVNGTIRLTKTLYFSIDPSADYGCSDGGIAVGNLANFLRVAGVDVLKAYPNKTYAEERNATYATCDNSSTSTVLVLKKGETNQIVQESTNCYLLEFKDCDVNRVSERFILATLAQSKGISI